MSDLSNRYRYTSINLFPLKGSVLSFVDSEASKMLLVWEMPYNNKVISFIYAVPLTLQEIRIYYIVISMRILQKNCIFTLFQYVDKDVSSTFFYSTG